MNVLWIATKAPWPPADGDRLVQLATLEALAGAGVNVTLVAPIDPARQDLSATVERLAEVCRPELVAVRRWPAPVVLSLMRSLTTGVPYPIARHARGAVERRVDQALSAGSFDVVHVEQLHAWPQARPARARGLPVVLRAQNVESDLWRAAAGVVRGWARWAASVVVASMAAYETAAVRRAAAAVALTGHDAERLRQLAGRPVDVVPAPFPAVLPAAEAKLPGRPAVVLLVGRGWLPNRDAERWFLDEVWEGVRRSLPEARLHVFGGGRRRSPGPGVEIHPPPADSREAFAPGAVLAVPLRIASGVRMKILEAWARGVAVVASPAAATGLDAGDGRELLLAGGAADFAAALGRLVCEPGLAVSLVAGGRALLASHHAPATVAARWSELYGGVVAGVGRSASAGADGGVGGTSSANS